MTIYYAHHQWKYNTAIENYELSLIKATYPGCIVCNPNGMLDVSRPEQEIMKHCLDAVSQCDMVVFSGVSGAVGKGVYTEVNHAMHHGKQVGYIFNNKIVLVSPSFKLTDFCDRIYATVKI